MSASNIMMKNCLFAMALLSLALTGGCAKGGNGIIPPPESVSVSAPTGISAAAIYPTQSITLTATVTGTSSTNLTWTMTTSSGASCTATTCGTLTPSADTETATYVAPASTTVVTVTATLVSNAAISGTLGINVTVATSVSPATVNVGTNLTQQFTAVATPNYAPQTFTWTCLVVPANSNPQACANFSPAPGVSSADPAIYTADDNCTGACVQIYAAPSVDTAICSANAQNCAIAKVTPVSFRVPNGTYAFRFSGYDNNGQATAAVGIFTVSGGTVTSGVEDELTSNGPTIEAITGGSYTATSSDQNNSNNAGTLALTLPSGVYPNQYQVVVDSSGDIPMIESDGQGTGSGIAEKSSAPSLLSGAQTYAFGFTGWDSSGNRVGLAGILPMNGSGAIAGGQMDANDNGNATNLCGAGPCNLTGTYSADSSINGLWHMILTAGSLNLNFDFFISLGTAGKTNPHPLTFYATTTGPIDTTHPAVSGTMVLQDVLSQTYTNAAFNGTSVSALTGTVTEASATCTAPPCSNVSLTLGTTDGTSGGTGGTGNFTGLFDQNNAGSILSVAAFPSGTQSPNPYTYVATNGNAGRYVFQMLGNPNASTVVPPIPFILYASGANRGFLLDQSSASVMTGTMSPQGKGNGILGPGDWVGTYAAATAASGNSGANPIAADLLLTFANTGACTSQCAAGTLYEEVNSTLTPVTLAGANPSYSIQDAGNGTIAFTTPAQSYVTYVVDTSGPSGGCSLSNPTCAIEDFFMIDVDRSNQNPTIIFARQ